MSNEPVKRIGMVQHESTSQRSTKSWLYIYDGIYRVQVIQSNVSSNVDNSLGSVYIRFVNVAYWAYNSQFIFCIANEMRTHHLTYVGHRVT